MDRRSFVKGAALAYAAISSASAAGAAELAQIKMPLANGEAAKPRKVPYKRIETEGAWGPREMFEMYAKLLEKNPFAPRDWRACGERSDNAPAKEEEPVEIRS